MLATYSLLLLLQAPVTTPTITGSVVLSYRTPSAWFGSSCISFPATGADPMMLASTWVYPPSELLGFRPSHSSSAPVYTDDTTRDLQFQTLSLSSPGTLLPPSAVDSLAFWNRKPSGPDGQCILLGFNSAAGPALGLAPAPSTWHYNLSSDCNNVNLQVPWSRFALSDDGATAVAWVQGSAGSLTLLALEGQSGRLRWSKHVPCGTPEQCQYFLAYGVDISGDGRFVVYDEGVEGGAAPHLLHVLHAADGSPRCPPLQSPGALPGHLSPNGDYAMTSLEDPGSGAPPTGRFAVWRWSPAASAYQRLPGNGSVPLADPAGHGWLLAQYAFSTDPATGEPLLGLVWLDASLLGPSVVAMYNASAVGAGPLASAHTLPLPGSDIANAGAVIDCAGSLCAAGLYTQQVGGPQPTLLVLEAHSQHAAYNFTTQGSVDSVTVARQPGSSSVYYVLATGCTSVGVCTQPGGDLVGLKLTVA
jgi:hypothetical protein